MGKIRYTRNHYLSINKNFRITVDSVLNFYKISNKNNLFINIKEIKNNIIVELKYDQNFDRFANQISNNLGFRLTKSSKYVQGIELLNFSITY